MVLEIIFGFRQILWRPPFWIQLISLPISDAHAFIFIVFIIFREFGPKIPNLYQNALFVIWKCIFWPFLFPFDYFQNVQAATLFIKVFQLSGKTPRSLRGIFDRSGLHYFSAINSYCGIILTIFNQKLS